MAAIRGDDRLKGKVAIVTGAGSRAAGIGNGRATAVVLARHGAQVTLVDSVAQWAEETKQLIEAEGGVSQIVEGDVSDPRIVSGDRRAYSGSLGPARHPRQQCRYHRATRQRGRGGPRGMGQRDARQCRLHDADGEICHSRDDQKRRRLDHQSQFGRGTAGGHPSLLYPTSKGAIVSLTRAMAAHHGRDGIRVNCIAPGTVYTPMVASRGMTPEMRKLRSESTLLGTEGTGWDIGYGALFLASDESRWITGITLPIDGGATAGSKGSPVPPSEPAKG
jgi:NAD(P)-dependent dehydrogenase (short-subunit alcohol dehydrogenase family)